MLRTEGPCADCESIEIGIGCRIVASAFIGPGAAVPAGTMVKAGEVWKNVAARL